MVGSKGLVTFTGSGFSGGVCFTGLVEFAAIVVFTVPVVFGRFGFTRCRSSEGIAVNFNMFKDKYL